MTDVLAIGEILVDVIAGNEREQASWRLQANAGGAPANVAVAVRRLGRPSGFCGSISRDFFGEWLTQLLDAEGVDQRFVYRCDRPTTLAFVQLGADGEREFSFYREQTSDTYLMPQHITDAALESTRAIHVCSVSLSRNPAREATLSTVKRAKEAGVFLSFDVNWRPMLWQDEALARQLVLRVASQADLVKMSEEEYTWLFESDDLAASERVRQRESPPIWVITRGDGPASVLFQREVFEVSGFRVSAVDTTGAGDAFTGAFLTQLIAVEFAPADEEALFAMTRFAHAAAALSVTRYGAIPALPTLAEVEAFLAGAL